MNYYKRHIGDYAAATRHLSMLEHGAYTMLLDVYYTSEQPLPADIKKAARKAGARSKDEVAAVEMVLGEFFTLQADGWHSARCDAEIREYAAGSEEREQKEANEKDRMKRHRERRAFMFAALRERDVVPAWDVSMKDLQRLYNVTCTGPETDLQRVAGRSHETPATAKPLTTNQEPITNNQGAFVEHQQGGPDGPAHADFENRTEPGAGSGLVDSVAMAMRAAGLTDVSATNPKLNALLAAGLTPAELLDAAAYAVGSGKGFAYAMARAEGQRRDAATAASLPAAPSVAAVDPDSKAGIEASAKALSLPGWDQTAEQWPQFAARVRKARGDAPAQPTLSLADLARIGVSA